MVLLGQGDWQFDWTLVKTHNRELSGSLALIIIRIGWRFLDLIAATPKNVNQVLFLYILFGATGV